MMLIEDNGLYILYSDGGRCLCSSADFGKVEKTIDKYAMLAGGRKEIYNSLVEKRDKFSKRFTLHEEYVKELWAQKFAYKYEDYLVELETQKLKEYGKVKLVHKKKVYHLRPKSSAREEVRKNGKEKSTKKVIVKRKKLYSI